MDRLLTDLEGAAMLGGLWVLCTEVIPAAMARFDKWRDRRRQRRGR